MSEFIDILSPSALKDLQTANSEIVKLIANIDKAGASMKNITVPSQGDGAMKNLTLEYQKQEKAILALQQKLTAYSKTAKQMEQQSIKESNARNSLNKQREKELALLDREQQKLTASQNLYNKVQAKLNALSNEYKALATRKELGIALTDKEAQRYTFLQGKIQTYDKTLKAVDGTMGKYTRNVGNYASGFSPISNSINQLTRELPAFTYSMQTGFMAISNNIPIFTDAIGNAIKGNKELIAQGKPVKSVLSQVAGAFLSWQTLMGVGITLLTVYGKEIGEFLKGLVSSGRALQTIATQTDQLNQSRKESTELASKEIAELDKLYQISTDLSVSIEERKKAVDKLQELYPKYLANISDENILNGSAEKIYYKLRDAIVAKYTAQAIGDKLAENARESLDEYLKLQQDIIDTEKEIIRLRTTGDNLVIQGSRAEKTQTLTISNNDLILAQEKLLLLQNKNLTDFKKRQLSANDLLIKSQRELLEQSKDLIIDENTKTDATTKNTKAKSDNNKETEKQRELIVGSVEWLEKEISTLKELQSQVSTTSEEWQAFDTELQTLIGTLEMIKGKAKEAGKELSDAVSISDSDLFGEGLKQWEEDQAKFFKKTKKDWKDTFDEIASNVQSAMSLVSELQSQQTEKRLTELETERDMAILFSGESASAKENAERQYEERKNALLKRQFEQEKRFAIAESIINTAVAVVRALPNVPLSIIVGALGLGQTAIIASQQMPAFAVGTDNAPQGWALTQEKGAEIITDKSGKVKTLGTNKGATKTYLNKGDKVFTAEQSKSIIFDSQLNNILSNNGILPPQIINNAGLSDAKFEKGINELKATIKNKSELHYFSDKQGERVYKKEQGKRALLVGNRLRIK